ncbi:MAG: hypothetical protein ACFFA0_16060 [Promethearchaeota archaeon]
MSKEKVLNHKVIIVRFLLIAIYLIVLVYFVYLLINFGANLFIIIIILIFTILITISLLYRRNKKSLYSKMFPDRKRKSSLEEKPKKIVQVQPKIFKKVDLEFNYRKPIIFKCENCGNTIPNFVKKCPFCGKQISY